MSQKNSSSADAYVLLLLCLACLLGVAYRTATQQACDRTAALEKAAAETTAEVVPDRGPASEPER